MDIHEIREKYRETRNNSTGSSQEEAGKRAAYSDFICITYEIKNIEDIKKLLQQFIENEEDEGEFMVSMRNAARGILADIRRIKC